MGVTAQSAAPAATMEAYPFEEAPERAKCAEWEFPRVNLQGRAIGSVAPGPAESAPAEDFAAQIARETQRSFEAGLQRGREEGRATERAAHLPAEQHRAQQLRRLMDDLASERDRYLREVEQEVVRLALSAAARILRRESEMDPLLLLGAVRVALGQLASGTEVRLHVPAADAALWQEALALIPHAPVRPVVVADEAMHLGDCRLETSLGHVDLGLDAQIREMDRGFQLRAPQPVPSRPAAQRVADAECVVDAECVAEAEYVADAECVVDAESTP